MNNFPSPIFLAQAASMASSISSPKHDVQKSNFYSVQFIWKDGSSPVGTVALQYSNTGDDDDFETDPDSVLDVSGNQGNRMIRQTEIAEKFMRAIYTPASGDGAMDIILVKKGWY